jgi:aspartate aminotransferase
MPFSKVLIPTTKTNSNNPMPKVSQRSANMPDSPFSVLIPLAEQAKANGIHVHHLNIGQPDIPTPQPALDSLKNLQMPVIGYGHALGDLPYREKLCGYYEKFGVTGLKPKEVVITQGASEALLFAFQACLNPGDNILIPEPFYANYNGFAGMGDIHVKPVTGFIQDGFALPEIQAFEQAIDAHTRALLINNPSNPTGTVYPEPVLRELAALVKKYDLFLIVDEVYREFCFGEQPFFSALRLEGLEDHVVVIDSISKRYSACGARTGAIVSKNPDLLHSIGQYCQQRISPGVFGQVVGEALLEMSDDYLDSVKAMYEGRRNVVYERLQQMPGVVSYLPGGAFYCFVELPVDDAFEFCSFLLESFSWKNQTLMLAHGQAFYASPGLGKKQARIAYVLDEANLHAAMDCLEQALAVYPGRTA